MTFWEYNDVRVNALALAPLHAFRRPLPEVFRERIMQPIGASRSWSWHACATRASPSTGKRCRPCPAAGTGAVACSRYRGSGAIGLLVARRGRWDGRRIIAASWLDAIAAPCALGPDYGLLWWLNTGGARAPAAARRSLFASGAGGHVTWIDPERDLASVTRWLDPKAFAGCAARVMAAVRA